MRQPAPATGWKRPFELLGKGVMFVLKPLQVVGNFVFLSVAYFLGVGLSALFYRLGPSKKKNADPSDSTYWRELPPAPEDREAWLRPF